MADKAVRTFVPSLLKFCSWPGKFLEQAATEQKMFDLVTVLQLEARTSGKFVRTVNALSYDKLVKMVRSRQDHDQKSVNDKQNPGNNFLAKIVKSFFLQSGKSLAKSAHSVFILRKNKGFVTEASEEFFVEILAVIRKTYMLHQEEELFGRPKVPNQIRNLGLLLRPDFMADFVETPDHARLQLQLSYHWHFEVTDLKDGQETSKLFSVPDLINLLRIKLIFFNCFLHDLNHEDDLLYELSEIQNATLISIYVE